jgi:hypothetical protein
MDLSAVKIGDKFVTRGGKVAEITILEDYCFKAKVQPDGQEWSFVKNNGSHAPQQVFDGRDDPDDLMEYYEDAAKLPPVQLYEPMPSRAEMALMLLQGFIMNSTSKHLMDGYVKESCELADALRAELIRTAPSASV